MQVYRSVSLDEFMGVVLENTIYLNALRNIHSFWCYQKSFSRWGNSRIVYITKDLGDSNGRTDDKRQDSNA